MFKKRLALGKESLLSSKDKKKLQAKVQGEVIQKNSKYKQNSVSGSRVKIISEEDQENWVPVFVDSDRFFPTVFFVWQNPEYLPTVFIWPAVSSYILNGADLMWPGVANKSQITESFRPGSVVSISIIGNLPLAVGILADSRPQTGGKGKCVEVLHHYMDELWMLHQHVPNEGFCIDEVRPLTEFLPKVEEKSENELNQQEKPEEVPGGPVEVLLNDEKSIKSEEIFKNIEGVATENPQTSEKNEEKSVLLEKTIHTETTNNPISSDYSSISEPQPTEELKTIESHQTSEQLLENPEEKPFLKQSPDQIILEIFLTALQVAVQPEDLPLEPSLLLSFMNRCKRSYSLDFSQTSFKKIGKFLQHASQLGLIDYLKPKNSDHKLITSINKSHVLFQDFVPIVKKMKNLETTSEEEKYLNYPKIVFTSGLVPKYEFHDFFSFVLPDRPRVVLQKSEVNSLLSKYLECKGLEVTKKTVKLDGFLQKVLKCSEEINKSDFFIKGRNLFTEGYLAEYSSGLLPAFISLGPLPLITITVTRGKGKFRKIMNVAGCDSYLIDMDELQTVCQKTFSATASVLKSEKKNNVVHELQMFGDHSEKLPKLLNDCFKVPASVIVVKNLT